MPLGSRWWGTWKLSAIDVQFSAPDGAGLGGGGEAGKGGESVESFLSSLQRAGSVLGSSGCPRRRAGRLLFLGLSCQQPPVLRWRVLLGPSEKMSILSKDA